MLAPYFRICTSYGPGNLSSNAAAHAFVPPVDDHRNKRAADADSLGDLPAGYPALQKLYFYVQRT